MHHLLLCCLQHLTVGLACQNVEVKVCVCLHVQAEVEEEESASFCNPSQSLIAPHSGGGGEAPEPCVSVLLISLHY